MLEWTGERYLPWIEDAALAYEHLHRYAFAAKLAAGRRVLDLACGEGYGANMLAKQAESVTGVDIDPNAVDHARARYSRANLKFVVGSALSIPIPESQCFDLIVCFEAIEHIEDQSKLLAEVKRLLKPDGTLLVSTPNKNVYARESTEDNPFHVHELELHEFQSLLRQFFNNITLFGQRTYASSSIWSLGGRSDQIEETVVARKSEEFEFVSGDQREPVYYIAAASDGQLPADMNGVMIDASNELLKDKNRAIKELLETRASNESALSWRENQLLDRDQSIEALRNETRELARSVTELQESVAEQEKGIAWLRHLTADLESEKQVALGHLSATQQKFAEVLRQFENAQEQLDLIRTSKVWQWVLRLRKLRAKLGMQ